MESLFSKIIKGEIPSYKIVEDESCFAFLDIYPKQKGHVLVVPKIKVDKIYELDDDIYNNLLNFAKKIASSLDKLKYGSRVGIIVEGLEVSHCHIHLIPISKPGDLHTKSKQFSESEMKQVQKDIISKL